jgi:hypothetical protein
MLKSLLESGELCSYNLCTYFKTCGLLIIPDTMLVICKKLLHCVVPGMMATKSSIRPQNRFRAVPVLAV